MKTKINNLITIGAIILTSILLWSCGKSDPAVDPVTPTFSASSASIEVNKSSEITIVSGTAPFTVSPSDPSIAAATVSANKITLTGIAVGQTVVNVLGKDGGKSSFSITITAKPDSYASFKSDAALRFERDGQATIVCENADMLFYRDAGQLFSSAKNKLGYANRAGSSYVLVEWEGNAEIGAKTNPTLRTESEVKNLTSLEIIKAEAGKVWLIYKDGTTEGRIVRNW